MNRTSPATASATPRPIDPNAASYRAVFRDACYITTVAAALALSVNALRINKLPLIAKTDFEILVPCPEPLGSAVPISPGDPLVADAKTLLIDARSSDEYAAWHLPSAVSIPFDWLAEQEQITKEAQVVARNVARSGKHAVVIYGDGGDPDSGQQWASLLNTAGIRNVTYITGGSVVLHGLAASKGQL